MRRDIVLLIVFVAMVIQALLPVLGIAQSQQDARDYASVGQASCLSQSIGRAGVPPVTKHR